MGCTCSKVKEEAENVDVAALKPPSGSSSTRPQSDSIDISLKNPSSVSVLNEDGGTGTSQQVASSKVTNVAKPRSGSSVGGVDGEIHERKAEREREKEKGRERETLAAIVQPAPAPVVAPPRPVARSLESEQLAAGWPAWLASVASEAIRGWVPRRADSFEKLDKIGQGTYSNVYKARDLESGKIVALKKVRFDNLEPESVRFMAREIEVLRRLDHPNVIKLEGLVTSRMSSSLYLVFEYMEHDLAGLAACPGISFSEAQVKCYLQQLMSGLQHCHTHGVLHRDIKGSNLLLDNRGTLKIADFGAGCILAELLAGKPIMPGRTEVEQLHKIFKLCGSPSEEYWQKSKLPHATIFKPTQPYKRSLRDVFKDFPGTALSLLDVLLSIDPAHRGTASSALAHEFFHTKPLPCDPSSLPQYPPSKEYDAKLRDEEARRHRAGGGRGSRAVNSQQPLQPAKGPQVQPTQQQLPAPQAPVAQVVAASSAVAAAIPPSGSGEGVVDQQQNHSMQRKGSNPTVAPSGSHTRAEPNDSSAVQRQAVAAKQGIGQSKSKSDKYLASEAAFLAENQQAMVPVSALQGQDKAAKVLSVDTPEALDAAKKASAGPAGFGLGGEGEGQRIQGRIAGDGPRGPGKALASSLSSSHGWAMPPVGTGSSLAPPGQAMPAVRHVSGELTEAGLGLAGAGMGGAVVSGAIPRGAAARSKQNVSMDLSALAGSAAGVVGRAGVSGSVQAVGRDAGPGNHISESSPRSISLKDVAESRENALRRVRERERERERELVQEPRDMQREFVAGDSLSHPLPKASQQGVKSIAASGLPASASYGTSSMSMSAKPSRDAHEPPLSRFGDVEGVQENSLLRRPGESASPRAVTPRRAQAAAAAAAASRMDKSKGEVKPWMLMGVQGDLPPSVAAALAAAAKEVGPAGGAGRTVNQGSGGSQGSSGVTSTGGGAGGAASAVRNGAVVVELSPRHKSVPTFSVEINASPRRPQRSSSISSPRASPSSGRGAASPSRRDVSPRPNSSRARRNVGSSPSHASSAASLKKRPSSVTNSVTASNMVSSATALDM